MKSLSEDVHLPKTPTQMLKSGFSIFSRQEIGLSLVALQMIFEALQSQANQIQFSFHEFENPKNPGIQPMYECKGGHILG